MEFSKELLKQLGDEKCKIVKALAENGWLWDMDTQTWSCADLGGVSYLEAVLCSIKKYNGGGRKR